MGDALPDSRSSFLPKPETGKVLLLCHAAKVLRDPSVLAAQTESKKKIGYTNWYSRKGSLKVNIKPSGSPLDGREATCHS
ncbi:MAG: hypothetical protein ACLVHJ_02150 [Blautia sp.]